MLKHIFTSAVLLWLFGLLGAGSVAVVYSLTENRILENQAATRLMRLHEVLPPERYDNDLLSDTLTLPAGSVVKDRPVTVYRARLKGRPVAVAFEATASDGYSGDIRLLIGVDLDGRILGVRALEHKETPGLGDSIETSRSDWILGFNGRSLNNPDPAHWAVKKDGGVFDQFTGATITPRAVVKLIKQVLVYYAGHREIIFAQEPRNG